ncbi:MAG: ATP synthase subunit I [Burkholderiaceae bacterium]|nr:ATP synthase subunit I [Burkholderiaceae bacterium]
MSTSLVMLIGAALAGAALGVLYLGLLWVSVRALAGQRPAVTFVALALARAALVLGALAGALVSGIGAGEILAALAGFVAVRVAATRRTHPAKGQQTWK